MDHRHWYMFYMNIWVSALFYQCFFNPSHFVDATTTRPAIAPAATTTSTTTTIDTIINIYIYIIIIYIIITTIYITKLLQIKTCFIDLPSSLLH